MWNMRCMIIPVINGATGRTIEDLKKNLEAIAGRHSTDSLQKTAVLGTAHIHVIRKVLQCETGNLSGGDRCCFDRRSARKERLVTRFNNSNNNNNNKAK